MTEYMQEVEFRVLEGSPILKYSVGELQKKFIIRIKHKHNPIASPFNKIPVEPDEKINANEFIKVEGPYDNVKNFISEATKF